MAVFELCEFSEVANFILQRLGKGVEYGAAIFCTGVSFREHTVMLS